MKFSLPEVSLAQEKLQKTMLPHVEMGAQQRQILKNKHLSTLSLKIVSTLGNKQHFTIWQEPAHTHLFTGPDLHCPNISTRLEVQNNH